MRILHLTEPRDGGVAENVKLLSEGMADRGHEVHVAGPPDAPMYPTLVRHGVRCHVIAGLRPGFGRPDLDLRAAGRVARLLARVRPDVIHCHSSKAGVVGRLIAPRSGVPVVFSPHSFSFVGDFSARRRRFALALERRLASRTALLVCVCRQERDQARLHGIDCPTRVIYHGTPAARDGVTPDHDLAEFARGGPVVASLSGLRPQKSIDVFLDAAPAILREVPSARIAVIGNGSEREALGRRADELGLSADDRFRFASFEPPSDRYLSEMSVYVLPSSWEAFPIGVLEAQAWGVPQVVTDVGGTAEAVDAETGALVAPHQPAALAAAVAGLLRDEPRRRVLAAASRGRHAERFTVARMVDETLSAYAAATGGMTPSASVRHNP